MAYQEKKRWVFLGLPFTFTKYTIEEEVITINSGLLNTRENDCYMYKVQDVELETSLAERTIVPSPNIQIGRASSRERVLVTV